MIIKVGTENKAKVDAVKDIIKDYDFISSAEVVPVNVSSDIADQPTSLQESITGAKNRAKNSFNNCNLSIGIESGLMPVPETKTGFMDVCIAAIYDGKQFHLGLSSAFEMPKKIVELVGQGIEVKKAFIQSGLSDNPNIGEESGAIGFLTKGRLERKEFTIQALRNALIHLENKDLF